MHSVKLPAGDMVIYPATSLHRVTPITRGARVSSFFWIESMIRDDAQRALLFDMDMALVRLNQQTPGHASLVTLTGCYHNLLQDVGRRLTDQRQQITPRALDQRFIPQLNSRSSQSSSSFFS